MQASKSIFLPISQTLFPYLSNRFNNNNICDITLIIYKLFNLIGFIGLIISALLYKFSEYIIFNVLESDFIESAKVLRLLAPIPFLVSMSNKFAVQGLYNLGKSAVVSKYISSFLCYIY